MFARKISLATAIILLNCLALAASAQDRLKVVTTFTVIADIAANVAGETAEVVSIIKPGAEIHGYSPTPGDLLRAANADLILWNGLNLEIWFEQFLANLGEVPAVTISDGVDVIPVRSGAYEGMPNPHAWMSLENGMIYVDNIASALARYDPENAAIYQKNAEGYKRRLEMILQPMRNAITQLPEENRWLVSCEGAFSYFARDFGLRELYLWPMNADRVGTPQQVRKVIDLVRKEKIPVVFCESTVNTAPAQQVARETDAVFGGVLYVDSLSVPDGAVPSYVRLLEVTAQTVVDGLLGAVQ
ncbi:MAG: metal ABC transporter substrate-binding protein [Aestuariivita sp.]|nr:metal ABC transporter substrate-binding protein [Aestuariivita sp.]MCY4201368.1 metal ABC transporter substrate-binding protein [Aestuariivita sp.]